MPSPEDVRAALAALPETEERETWGHPTFRVRSKMFGSMAADGTTVTLKAQPGEQEALVQADPATFFVPKYVGMHGWVGITLQTVDPGELAELVTEAWRMTAPKRAVRAFDDAVGSGA